MTAYKYLTEAISLVPAVDKWAVERGVINANGGLLVMAANNNLSDVADRVAARRNLGLIIGSDVQPFSPTLASFATTSPNIFSLNLLSKGSQQEWRDAIGAGTVQSVNVNGGSTGLLFTGGEIITSGTFTLGGTLRVENGGTGTSSLVDLKTGLSLNNVDNTRDIDKPISSAAQLQINSLTDQIALLQTRIEALEAGGGTGPQIPANALTSALDSQPLKSAIDDAYLTSAIN